MHKAVCAILLLSLRLVAADLPPQHVRNFGQVDDKVWRGAEPSAEALRELRDRGVKLILDLREHASALERQQTESLGMRYCNLPFRSMQAPRPEEVHRALAAILGEQEGRTFVHCWRGKDRTGTVIACYRIQHDGWQNADALDEAKSFGMSHLEIAMQRFIMHFKAVDLASLLAIAGKE